MLRAPFSNPTSTHGVGRAAKTLLEEARTRLAQILDGRPEDVTFTSGGTEAVALGLIGLSGVSAGRIAISAVEHSCVRAAAEWLQIHRGWEVDIIPVESDGRITPAIIDTHLHPKTRLVAIMMVNNEIGTINRFSDLVPVIRRKAPRARVVVDAAQGLGKVPFSVRHLDLDAMAVNGHKLHGPKGIGALWCAHAIQPIFRGGGQESGRRGGTPSAVLAWAFAEAAERQKAAEPQIKSLGEYLWASVRRHFPDVHLNGPPLGTDRVPNNVHVCIPGVPTEPLINALSSAGVYVSGERMQ